MWNTSGSGCPVSRAVRPDRADTADAEQDLLREPVLLAAAVEPVGDLAQRGSFSSMSESSSSSGTRPTWAIQICAASSLPSGSGTPTRTGAPAPSRSTVDRQALRVERRVVLLLPAVGGQRLA